MQVINMKAFFYIIFFTLFSFTGVYADIFKCETADGQIAYTEIKCETGSLVRKIKQQVQQPRQEYTNQNTNERNFAEEGERSDNRSKIRSLDLKIKKRQNEIDSLIRKRDKEIETYTKKINRNIEKAGKNEKKAALRNKSLNEKVKTIKDNYNRNIEKKQNKIAELQEQKSKLK